MPLRQEKKIRRLCASSCICNSESCAHSGATRIFMKRPQGRHCPGHTAKSKNGATQINYKNIDKLIAFSLCESEEQGKCAGCFRSLIDKSVRNILTHTHTYLHTKQLLLNALSRNRCNNNY